ncbi:MAG: thioesterase family protein [Oscillospiraceae bacterium]|nr:thioesterase family protein [Oscillospiraceae bacterium]MBR2365999.1 thioesterase family protein [Oscillospiraceae bacterium]MBR3849911.1 thioesterase family protein [Oscillospiraceae bacterium]
MELKIGIRGTAETVVTEENTAKSAGSGNLQVFGTPYMIALMEKAACEAVAPYLDEGCTTVGTQLNVAHLAATPLGDRVTAEVELVEIDRRRLCFKVTARDSVDLIGEGTHERFIIQADRFLEKANAKKGS